MKNTMTVELIFVGAAVLALLSPGTVRTVLLVLLVVGYAGYRFRKGWLQRMKRAERHAKDRERRAQERQKDPSASAARTEDAPVKASASAQSPSPLGAELYAQARALPHKPIPDFKDDGEYLELLGRAAAEGYAPALAKLGEYALRRTAWVEAYYWMTRARRSGMQGLSRMLLEIRRNWAVGGYRDEAGNVNDLFTSEASAIGLALLHVDSGHRAANARAFLKANHPEFL